MCLWYYDYCENIYRMVGMISDFVILYLVIGVWVMIFIFIFLFNVVIIYVLFFLGVREILLKKRKKYFVIYDIMVFKVCG